MSKILLEKLARLGESLARWFGKLTAQSADFVAQNCQKLAHNFAKLAALFGENFAKNTAAKSAKLTANPAAHSANRAKNPAQTPAFRRAFSLLEMLLALAVVAISAGGIAASVESSARLHSYAILSEQIAQSEAKMLALLAEPYGRAANSRRAADWTGSREFFDWAGVASHSGQLVADGGKTRLNLAYDVDVSHAGGHKRIALTTRFGGGAVRLVGWAHNVGEMGAQDSRVMTWDE